MALKDEVWRALRVVPGPDGGADLVSGGLVQRVAACGESVTVSLDAARVPTEAGPAVRERVMAVVRALPGISNVVVEVTTGAPQARPVGERARPTVERARPAGIRSVVAVGSGKGGVGKSTVAVSLAVALAATGRRVGLMDADAYGPNVPRMLGVDHLPPPRDGLIVPAEAFGVRVVSVGFLVKPDVPLVWRGPRTDTLVRQFLTDVAWGDLDLLVVDLPPGTGDIAIALAHHAQPDGAVVVSTPQAVAADDARKAIAMFRRLGVRVLGVVQNMSGFVCEGCGTRHELFGSDGAHRLADEAGVPLLGDVPLVPDTREAGDTGFPIVLRRGTAAAGALDAVAGRVWHALDGAVTSNQEVRT